MVGQSDNQILGSGGMAKPRAIVENKTVTGSHSKAISTTAIVFRFFILACATVDSNRDESDSQCSFAFIRATARRNVGVYNCTEETVAKITILCHCLKQAHDSRRKSGRTECKRRVGAIIKTSLFPWRGLLTRFPISDFT